MDDVEEFPDMHHTDVALVLHFENMHFSHLKLAEEWLQRELFAYLPKDVWPQLVGVRAVIECDGWEQAHGQGQQETSEETAEGAQPHREAPKASGSVSLAGRRAQEGRVPAGAD